MSMCPAGVMRRIVAYRALVSNPLIHLVGCHHRPLVVERQPDQGVVLLPAGDIVDHPHCPLHPDSQHLKRIGTIGILIMQWSMTEDVTLLVEAEAVVAQCLPP